MNGFGVIRIFFDTFPHISFDHIVEDLENIAYHNLRIGGKLVEKLFKWNGKAPLKFAHTMVEVVQGLFNALCGRSIILEGGCHFFRRRF